MSEEQSSTTLTQTPEVMTAPATQTKSSPLKEFAVPISIMVAGAFIGAGLFFGGGGGTPAAQLADTNPIQQPSADTTDSFDPITDEDYVKGPRDAAITIVEYSDFDCPFCSRFHNTMNQVVANSETEIAWVYRHFPLEQLHPNAFSVAVAAECVGEQGGNDAFWQFTDSYFEARASGDNLSHGELVPRLVLEAGAERTAFTECFESGRYNEVIQSDIEDALETGGRGTPWSILIGPNGKTYPISGAQPAQVIEQVIQAALAEV